MVWYKILCLREKFHQKFPSELFFIKNDKAVFWSKFVCEIKLWKDIDHCHFEVQRIALRSQIISETSATIDKWFSRNVVTNTKINERGWSSPQSLRHKSEMSLKKMDHRNIRHSDLCVFISGNHRYQQFLWGTSEILMKFGFSAIFELHFHP
jgi:hypothetical protein